jgi:hypothetical protein
MTKPELNHCELWHPDSDKHEAVDYIVQQFGESKDAFFIHVPVCRECILYLTDGQLKLYYCYNCGASQWKMNDGFRMTDGYHDNITWVDKCPECEEVLA